MFPTLCRWKECSRSHAVRFKCQGASLKPVLARAGSRIHRDLAVKPLVLRSETCFTRDTDQSLTASSVSPFSALRFPFLVSRPC